MSPCPGEEKVNRSRIKFSLLILAALAVVPATFGQGWPLAAKTPNTPVACPATSPACVDRVGKFTAPYGDPIKTFVGRYLDSQMTREYQAPFRTARARLVGINTQRNRIYMIIGSALFAYDLPSFIDRLLAPIEIGWLAVEKVVAGMIQAAVAGLVVLPAAWLVMGAGVTLDLGHLLELVLIALLVALFASAGGLALGCSVGQTQVGLMFSLVLAPMMMFGCAYYPWSALSKFPVLQKVVLINPLVYASEGFRSALAPGFPHLQVGICLAALAAFERAYDDRAVEFSQIAQWPPFETIASDPRFTQLVSRLNLPTS